MSENTQNKLFFLDQHGCAKNQVDGELLISRLEAKGFKRTDEAEKADLIIVNSCGFIESAKEESLNSLFEARSAFPDKKIVLAGCLAERYAADFAENLPEADAIFGNGDLALVDTLVDKLFVPAKDQESTFAVTAPQEGVCCGPRSEFLNFPASAYVKITEGCNNCCSFCAIPLIRGELRSRDRKEIVEEIKTLLEKGIFEINLIGQDLAGYGRDGVARGDSGNAAYFAEPSPLRLLLEDISALKGDFWLRLLYIHPDHFPRDIIPVIKADPRLLAYFDIPFQSGSNQVLKAMNRSGSAQSYAELSDFLRKSFDGDVTLRTTFLCGFPGETADNAKETEAFLSQVKPDWSGCFEYSREEDTAAYSMKNQVPFKTANKRAEKLRSMQEEISAEKLCRHMDKDYTVLIEEVIDDPENDAGIALGRCWFQAPEVDGATVVRYELDDPKQKARIFAGSVVKVHVTGVTGFDLDSILL